MELQKRELMYVDDLAEACEYFLKRKPNTLVILGAEKKKQF